MSALVTSRARAQGFGLIEIMIAMTLSLFLLAGIYQLFLSNKLTYNTQQSLSRLQENARYVMHTLSHDLRMAGHTGCRSADTLRLNVIAGALHDSHIRADGFDAVSGDDGSNDRITVRGAGALPSTLTRDMASAKQQIWIGSNLDRIDDGGLAYIADCSSGDVFRVSKVHDSAGAVHLQFKKKDNTSKALSKPYGEQAEVYAFRLTRYYVADSDSATRIDGAPLPALWRSEDGRAMELVPGVQAMQIEYGVDTDRDAMHSADAYRRAGDVGDWADVVAVRFAVLIQSLEPATDAADKTTTYPLLEQTVGPFNDRYLRRVLNFTVALRNRVH